MPATRVSAWLPVVAWATVIFAFSSISSLGTGLGAWDVLLRKAAHLVEFAVLGALLARALSPSVPAVVLGCMYAATDELHQTFVPGRVGAPLDWALDSVGVVAGVLLFARVRARREVETGTHASEPRRGAKIRER